MVAGDFNGNPWFDKPRQKSKWADVFGRINELGSLSAYHHVTGLGYGDEGEATHHHRRNADSKFHIDFCFVPRAWCAAGVKAAVAQGEPWVAIGDHFPVVVDVMRE